MNEAMGNPFEAEFNFENNRTTNLHQQQLRNRLSILNTKNGDWPPGCSQFLLSPASSATTSSNRQCGNGQQHPYQTPVLQGATTHIHLLDPDVHNPLTPPDDHEHDAYQLDSMLNGSQPAEHVPPASPPDTAKWPRAKSCTKKAPGSTTRRYRHPAPSQPTPATLSAEPSSPKHIKRVAFLERNRMAAFKCRAKKKEWTVELEERAQELKRSKDQHTVAVASLKSEILYLKEEVLRHWDCGNHYVPADSDSPLNGSSHDAAGNVGTIGDRPSHLPTTAYGFPTQGIAIQADNDTDTDGDFLDETNEYSHSSMHPISNRELEALLTRQIAQDKSGK